MTKHQRDRGDATEPPWHYVPGRSFVHRAPAVLKTVVAVVTFFVFLRMERPAVVVAALVVFTALYLASGLTIRHLWKDLRFVVFQAAIIGTFAALMEPGWQGVRLGGMISMKLILFFFPVTIWLRTTLISDLLYGMRSVVRYKYLFLIGIGIQFMPYLLQEFRDIVEAQRLRGVNLGLCSLFSPRGVREIAHCLLVPLVVRILKTSEEIRLSAISRGLEVTEKRTYLKDA